MTDRLPTQHAAATTDYAEELRALWGVLRRRWQLVLVIVAVCMTAAGLSLAATKRAYLATVRLLILQRGGRPLSVAGADPTRAVAGNDDYIPTQAVILRSPLVVSQAIAAIGRDKLPSLRGESDPTSAAIKLLSVTRPDRQAKVLQVDYQAGTKQEATRFVGAVADSYRKFLETSDQRSNGEVVRLITKAREDLRAEVGKLERQYIEYRAKSTVLKTDDAGRSFISRRLEGWDRAANDAMIKEVELRAQLELGRKLAADGAGMGAISHALGQVGAEPSGLLGQAAGQSTQSEYVRQLVQEQESLAERYGPQYSKVRDLHDQIARVQERALANRGRLDKAEARELIAAIDQALKATQEKRLEFSKRFETDLKEAQSIELELLTQANLKANVERHRALYNTVVDQLKQAELAGDYGGIGAQVIEPPHALSYAVKPRVMLTLALTLLTGSLLGVGVALGVDRLDRRLRTADEMQRALGLGMLGGVPALSPSAAAAVVGGMGRISHSQPRSIQAEAYKVARTHVEVLRRQRNAKVLLITSPRFGDGKSTTSSNLAITLAQAGRRVLLIDGDLRKPTQDRFHQLRRDHGFIHLLREPFPLEWAVQASGVPNLDIVTVGPVVPNPAELLMSSRLGEVIEEARNAYDIVLIDSSPLLSVTDPTILGALVDAVVVVARVGNTDRREAQRAVEILNAVGTPVLGVIINGTDSHDRSYSYGYGVEPDEPAKVSSKKKELAPGYVLASCEDGAGSGIAATNGFHS